MHFNEFHVFEGRFDFQSWAFMLLYLARKDSRQILQASMTGDAGFSHMAACWQTNSQHTVEGVTWQQMERVGQVNKRKQSFTQEVHDSYYNMIVI